MAMSRGPHVRELFIGYQGFQYEEKESKSSFNISNKNQSGAPRLGAFKPKILSGDSSGNIPLPKTQLLRDPSLSPSEEGTTNNAFIIGDKDVPMLLEPTENIYSEISDTAADDSDQTTSNPLFSASPARSADHRGNVYRESLKKNEEINGVSVPPPDYDEDEMTLDFEGDDNHKSGFQELAGEDFGKYLSDDDEDFQFDRPVQTVRSKAPVSKKVSASKYKKAKTEAWRPRRDSSKSLFTKNTKNTNAGKNTVRHISVTDLKLGMDLDGTVKQPKQSIRDSIPMDQTYESFLLARNGGPRWGSLESASSDSGHEPSEKQSPFWKKLTVKIKKVGYGLKH